MVSRPMSRIGVLALQGAFHLHREHLEAARAEYVEINRPGQLGNVDGLILPGGESGVMLKLLEWLEIEQELSTFLMSKPSWGICAGAILMAKKVSNPDQRSFGVLDIDIERNSYGRQLESTEAEVDGYRVSYIRAPKIQRVGEGLKVLSSREGNAVCVESSHALVTTFHPETNLSWPSPWHLKFVKRVRLAIGG